MTGGLLRNAYFGSRLYELTLGTRPARIERYPVDAWLGDPLNANAMFQGRYVAAGQEIVQPNQAPWALEASPSWAAHFNAFGWLRDFRAVGGTVARQRARDLTQSWLALNARWSEPNWRAGILGRRVAAWIHHADFLLNGARGDFTDAFLLSLGRQVRHLRRIAKETPPGAERIAALIGLDTAAIALVGGRRWQGAIEKLLGQEVGAQVLGDGGHVSRNPSALFTLLRDLIGLRVALTEMRFEPPAFLVEPIERMISMLRLYRHGDGALALFNGGSEEAASQIDAVLAIAEGRHRPPASAAASGFERLAAGRTTIILDTGHPPPPPFDAGTHAGCLSFEMSVGIDRLIVNCGAPLGSESSWHEPLRATAAHSTVVVADTNALDLRSDGVRRRALAVGAARTDAEDGTQIVTASHDGYARTFQAVHQRQLTLHRTGDRVSGEDRLIASAGANAPTAPFAARFHLHPDVRASLQQDRRAVILRLPRGSGWIFEAETGDLAVEESVYLGKGSPRRTSQIVLAGAGEAPLLWSLARVGE